ncbi:MAG: hypothetical protein EBS06_05420 [Proteobacteria bacterium]|nr:hypothetical protein [Pseudomonadota bacterium]
MKEIYSETNYSGDKESFLEDDKGQFFRKVESKSYNKILENNAEVRKNFDKNDAQFKKSEFRRTGSIPFLALEIKAKELKMTGPQFLDWFKSSDGQKWIKSPECEIFRTVSNSYQL